LEKCQRQGCKAKFTEERLEQAIIELLQAECYPDVLGQNIDREPSEVLIKDDLKTFLARQYASDNITPGEIKSIIRKLEVFFSCDLYESNKAIFEFPGERNEQYL